ncbi:MAG: ThuA domain-containing protein [Chthonomonadales bacterium]
MKRIDIILAVGAMGLVCLANGSRTTVNPVKQAKPIRALLVLGGCCHDYEKQKDIITKGLSERANITFTVAYDPDKGTKHLNPIYEKADWAKDFDVVIHDECTSDVKDLESINKILEPHKNGLPAVLLHCGEHSYRSETFPKTTPWFEFTGLASTGHGPQVPISLTFTDQKHRITKDVKDWTTVNEELYNNIDGKLLDTARALATGKQSYKNAQGEMVETTTVVAWINIYNAKTRVFCTTIGHNNETVSDPRYLDMVTKGLLWSTRHLAQDGTPAAGYAPAKPAQ